MTYNPIDNLAAYQKKIAWAPEDAETAAEMWQEGKSATQISRVLQGRHSRNSVISKMSRMGVQTPTMPSQGRAKPPKPKRVPKPPKLTRDDRITALNEQGYIPRDIASKFSVRTHVILEALHRLGLKPNLSAGGYHMHPMWSMGEDDRRQAFYEKFTAGWVDVLKRLADGS